MSFKKHFSFLLLFIGINATQVFSQKKTLLITQLLDTLSKKHKIHFTYKSNLLKNKIVDIEPFNKLSLKKSIDLLKKTTSLNLDYLGNNYYVIYAEKPTNSFNTSILKDSLELKK